MPLSEHVYCVAITFKMTEQAEQQICIKFCIKVEHSSTEPIQIIHEATAMGNWWLAALSWQCSCSYIMSHEEFFVKHQITHMIQLPYSPDLAPCNFLLFSKLKSPLKGKRFLTINWDLGKYCGAADGSWLQLNWEKCVKSQSSYFEGDWGFIVLHIIFLVSCILFNKCCYFSYYMAGYLLDRPRIYILKILIIFRKKEREGEREGQKHWCARETSIGCLLHNPDHGLGLHPCVCPDQELNWRLFTLQDNAQSAELCWSKLLFIFLIHFFRLLKKDSLTFLAIVAWWWWTPLAFTCIGNLCLSFHYKW